MQLALEHVFHETFDRAPEAYPMRDAAHAIEKQFKRGWLDVTITIPDHDLGKIAEALSHVGKQVYEAEEEGRETLYRLAHRLRPTSAAIEAE